MRCKSRQSFWQNLLSAGAIACAGSATLAEPVLAVAGTMDATEDYAVVLDGLEAVGADATTLTLFWDQMEVDGVYTPNPNWPEIADLVYPSENLQLSLMISVIDTVADRRPVDLQQMAFSDPVVIARFESFLTEVLTAMPEVTLTSIGIGNEVDVYRTDENYDDFAVFFAAASDVAHRLVPGVPVGASFTWDGLQSDWLVAGQITTPGGFLFDARALFDDSTGLTVADSRIAWQNDRLSVAANYIWQAEDAAENLTGTVSAWTVDAGIVLSDAWRMDIDGRYDVAADQPVSAGLAFGWQNECVNINVSASRSYTSSSTVDPSTTFGLSGSLTGFSAGRSAGGLAAGCRN